MDPNMPCSQSSRGHRTLARDATTFTMLGRSIFLLLVLACTKSATCKSEAFPTSFLPRSRVTLFATSMLSRGGGGTHPATLSNIHDDDEMRENIPLPWTQDKARSQAKKNGKTPPKDTVKDSDNKKKTLLDQAIPAEFVAETNLPTDLGNFRLRAYRADQSDNRYVGTEPCVIYSTDKPPFGKDGEYAKHVPIRVHDQCFTSEVFRSQRCDCRDQLKMSLDYIQKHGGAIIYLQQEGRGIGLANKVAAYALQDVGMDTVDANIHLGFPEDCRQYGAVPAILEDMKVNSIQLMTNNPRKVDRLTSLGIKVEKTLPMVVKRANMYNRRYLETKRMRMNHTNFGAMLSAADMPLEREGLVNPGRSIAEAYINVGEEMAAHAVQLSLLEESDASQAGVVVLEDGYCFGRQSVEEAIQAVKEGKMVVVVDDMDRENEGDLIMAADACTPEAMANIVRYSSGVVCVAMEGNRMDELNLPSMVAKNQDPKNTAFSITVDATKEHGISTGISARDRSKTVQLLASGETKENDFVRPGHIFPLRARSGGVLTRDGHTEAAVDLSRLAEFNSCGVLCEIVSEEEPTEMARLPELKRFARKHGLVLTSIADLIQYRRDTSQ